MKQQKRLTVIELAAYLREQIPPGISEEAINRHIRKAGLKRDKFHKVSVPDFLDAYMRHKAEDNKNISDRPPGVDAGQDPRRYKTMLECMILKERLATIKGEQILVVAHHAEIQELAGFFTAAFAQWISEIKVLTGDAKLVQAAERLRDRTLEHARALIEQNTHKEGK